MLADGVAEAAIDLVPAPRHGIGQPVDPRGGPPPVLGEAAGGQRRGGGSADRHGPGAWRPVPVRARRGRHEPLPLAGRAHRLGTLRRAHAGRDAPRRSRPGGVARVHGRPDTVLRRRRGPGLRPWRVSPARADDAARAGRAGPGDGHDRDADPGGPRRSADWPHDRGHDARPRPDQPAVRERGPRPAAGELRHAQLARPLAGAAFPDGHAELQRSGLRRRRSGQPVRR